MARRRKAQLFHQEVGIDAMAFMRLMETDEEQASSFLFGCLNGAMTSVQDKMQKAGAVPSNAVPPQFTIRFEAHGGRANAN